MSGPTRECDLDLHEKLVLWRRRLTLSRADAARALKVTPWQVAEAERNRAELGVDVPWTGDRALRDHERCIIYRRRAGVTQARVASDLGVTRVWVNRMERGSEKCCDLLWYWEQ